MADLVQVAPASEETASLSIVLFVVHYVGCEGYFWIKIRGLKMRLRAASTSS